MNTTIAQESYIVKKNGRKIPNKVFATYEKARQFVRKRVRASDDRVPVDENDYHWNDFSDANYRTPSLGFHGYSISKQAEACQRVEV